MALGAYPLSRWVLSASSRLWVTKMLKTGTSHSHLRGCNTGRGGRRLPGPARGGWLRTRSGKRLLLPESCLEFCHPGIWSPEVPWQV